MEIQGIEKSVKNGLVQNKICRDLSSSSSCVHNDQDETLIIYSKYQIKSYFYTKEFIVKFCPYCGFTYQPERLSPEASDKEDAIV